MSDDEYSDHIPTRIDDLHTSKEWAAEIDAKGWQQMVHDAVKRSGIHGLTIKECAQIYGPWSHVKVSPCFALLRRAKHIFYCGEDRERGSVWLDTERTEEWVGIASPEALRKMNTPRRQRIVTCPCCRATLLIEGKEAIDISAGTQPDMWGGK